MLAAFQNDPAIEFAERDGIAEAAFVPNDVLVTSGVEWHLAKIHALEGWDYTIGSPGVIVAVLDSGVNAAHPIWRGLFSQVMISFRTMPIRAMISATALP
jgi:hypothetical protein